MGLVRTNCCYCHAATQLPRCCNIWTSSHGGGTRRWSCCAIFGVGCTLPTATYSIYDTYAIPTSRKSRPRLSASWADARELQYFGGNQATRGLQFNGNPRVFKNSRCALARVGTSRGIYVPRGRYHVDFCDDFAIDVCRNIPQSINSTTDFTYLGN